MYIWGQLALLVLGGLTALFSNIRFKGAQREVSERAHRMTCVIVFAIGCLIRFFRISELPAGLNAEEALVGIQAKSIWQTGGFLFGGHLTTSLAQWSEEATGPLLSVMAAPFVAVFGMSSFAVRLPLTLISICAMLAAYGIGKEVNGKKTARWCLSIYALCPVFILDARFAVSANLSVFLMPVALYFLIAGLRRNELLYAGMVFMGLMHYTQRMYFFIAPIAIVGCAIAAWKAGSARRHVICACAFGIAVCFPAVLTVCLNAIGGESFLLGAIEIPNFGLFDVASKIWKKVDSAADIVNVLQNRIRDVLKVAVFQNMEHEAISSFMFVAEGMGALFMLSIPMIILGSLVILVGRLPRTDETGIYVRRLVLTLGLLTMIVTAVFSDGGKQDTYNGITNVHDYSSLLLFIALLTAIGFSRMEEKSVAGRRVMACLFSVSVMCLCIFVFGGRYQEQANAHFTGLEEACARAGKMQREKDAKVYMTTRVYPHVSPSEAAEIMYLYASDADTVELIERREETVEVVYLNDATEPDEKAIYIVMPEEIAQWNLDAFDYEEFGSFVLLTPIEVY